MLRGTKVRSEKSLVLHGVAGRIAGHWVHRNDQWQSSAGAQPRAAAVDRFGHQANYARGAALSKLLNQAFQGVPAFPPMFGSGENLGDS